MIMNKIFFIVAEKMADQEESPSDFEPYGMREVEDEFMSDNEGRDNAEPEAESDGGDLTPTGHDLSSLHDAGADQVAHSGGSEGD